MRKNPGFLQNIEAKDAIALQQKLGRRVILQGGPRNPRLVCGCDLAFSSNGKQAVSAAVVWDVLEKRVVEQQTMVEKVRFPYIPGLLSFREAPALWNVIAKLECAPELFMFDGHGVAHPRGFGLASHMGVMLDRSSIGCAKSILVGRCGPVGNERGDVAALEFQRRRIGMALRTRSAVHPVYVSVGHKISLKRAVDIVLKCGGGFRLPEPTRLADRLVAHVKSDIW